MNAAELVRRFSAAGLTLATAESITGGLVASAITDVPGASAVFRGCVVAYATELKYELLGVDRELLDRPVSEPVATAMAVGARLRLAADWALATTGVAGPDPQGGEPPGVVWFSVAGPPGSRTWRQVFKGDRAAIRAAAVEAALAGLGAALPG